VHWHNHFASRPLQLQIAAGVVAAHGSQTVVILKPIDGSQVRVRDVATGIEQTVPVCELSGAALGLSCKDTQRRWEMVRARRARNGFERDAASGSLCASEELPHGFSGTGIPYFGKALRLQPPFDANSAVRTLSSVNDPAQRCPALWWAHVLLAESHRCCNPGQIGLHARQWHLLRSRCPAGLHGSENVWAIGHLNTFASTGLLLNRCFDRKK
jgi:hypothetical protein